MHSHPHRGISAVMYLPIEQGKRLSQKLETQTFHNEHPKLPIRSMDRLSFLRMTQEVQALGLLVSVS